MPTIKYENWNPSPDVKIDVRRADAICAQYAAQGYDLTLRQLFYQFVAKGWIPNTMKSYKRLGEIVNKARLAGLLDWDYIVDRTRNLRGTSHWGRPGDIINSAAYSFRLDKWRDQPHRCEIWIEKEALAGVIERVANEHDVQWFACRGYVSQSEQWAAARRLLGYIKNGQAVTILHLGDHDPSGLDMTRDIRERLENFLTQDWLNAHPDTFDGDSASIGEIIRNMRERVNGLPPIEVRRIALNYDQVEQYEPPPNPTKLTDSRANGYIAVHGYESWELDALPPEVLAALVRDNIEGLRDDDRYDRIAAQEARHRELLTLASNRWTDIVAYLEDEQAAVSTATDVLDDEDRDEPLTRDEPPADLFEVYDSDGDRWDRGADDEWTHADMTRNWQRLWDAYGPLTRERRDTD